MLLLYTCCILQYVFDKNVIATEQMSPHLLETSLQHINTLLTDIGDKILREKQILSHIESDKEKQGARQNQFDSVPFNKAAARKLIELWKILRSEGVVPELEKDPFDDTEFTIPTTTTKRENILDKSESKRMLLDFMKTNHVSYGLAALHRLFLVIYEKTEEEVEVFFDALTTAIWSLADNGKLECLEPLLRNRLLRATIWTKLVEPLIIREYIGRLYIALDKREFVNHDAERIVSTYDSLFTDEEGDQLLNTVLIIEAYDMVARGKDQTSKICENFINKFLAPVHRLCGTLFLKTLIKDMNLLYSSINPTGARSIRKRSMDSLIDNKPVTAIASRQAMYKRYKHVKRDYRRNILQLFVKFPTIFEEFAKYYRNNENSKYANKQKIFTSQHTTNCSTRTIKLSERIPKKFFSQNVSENMSTKSYTLNYLKQDISLNTQNKPIKRLQSIRKPITVVNDSSIDILVPSVTDNSIKKYMGNYTIHFEKSNFTKFYLNFTQRPYSTKRRRKKAKKDKIIEESSYSDDEMYLQVMLKDALFHGNNQWSG